MVGDALFDYALSTAAAPAPSAWYAGAEVKVPVAASAPANVAIVGNHFLAAVCPRFGLERRVSRLRFIALNALTIISSLAGGKAKGIGVR